MSDWQREDDRLLWRAAQYSHIYGQEAAQDYLAWNYGIQALCIVLGVIVVICIAFPVVLVVAGGVLFLFGGTAGCLAIRNAYRAKVKREAQEAAIERHQAAVDRLLHDLQVALASGNDAAVGEVCKTIAKEEAFGFALPHLRVALGDIDPCLRLCAIRGLRWGAELREGHLSRGSAANTTETMPSALLAKVIGDTKETTQLRVAAAITVGNGGYTILFGHLTRFLSDSNPDVRSACCHAIGKQVALLRVDTHARSTKANLVTAEERRQGFAAVLNMLRDSSQRARQEAAQTLGEFRNPEALRPLQELAADRSQPDAVRRAASDAVAAIKLGTSI